MNPFRKVLLAAAGSAAVTGVAWLIGYGAARGFAAVTYTPDANIGAGLVGLAVPLVVIPTGLTLWLRRLRVRGAVPIGALGSVVYLAELFAVDAPHLSGLLPTVLVGMATFAVYAAAATLLTSADAPFRLPKPHANRPEQ